ncbi:hypothetical protein ABT096_29210 [Streptomyces sp. NPDC002561]|uniref:hypothetical protein n=1 Tax=Streptomyces sp. NPDC002561 TaxID=3154418 RepID=UPI003332514A
MVDKEAPVAQEKPETAAEDAEAIAVSDAALRDFTIELNRLHISFGAPSYAAIAKASVRPKLTKAGINEALAGKRLPSIDSLMEFVRVVSSPLPPPADAPAPRCRPDLAEAWQARWQEVKFAQRRAVAPWRRLRSTVRETLDEAYREAQAVREAAHKEADRISLEAEAVRETAYKEADRILREAQAVRETAYKKADLLLADAQRTADIARKLKPRPAKNTGAAAESPAAAPAAPPIPFIPPELWAALLKGISFWFSVPKPTTLFPEDGGTTPVAVLAPGQWYLAIGGNQSEFTAQTGDGRRGLVRDFAQIQVG